MCKCGCGKQNNYGNKCGYANNGYNNRNHDFCRCRRDLQEAEDVIQAIYDLADDYLEDEDNGYDCNKSYCCNNNNSSCRCNYWGRY